MRGGGWRLGGALEQVEVVRALVGQHATALACPRAAPAATVLSTRHSLRGRWGRGGWWGGVKQMGLEEADVVAVGAEPRRDDPVDALDLTKLAVRHHLPHLLIRRVVACTRATHIR